MERIGFIGLGNMGLPMATGLVKEGYSVTGYDINEKATLTFKERGGGIATSIHQVLAACDVILTSLPSVKAAEEVFLGERGLVEQGDSSKILVDTSTVSPELNQMLDKSCTEKGIPFLAAPVSGGVIGAEQQTLTVMVGGKRAVYERVLPIFEVIGGNIFHVNEQIDSGTTVKLINNLLIGFYTAGVSEALHIANKKNIDLNDLYSMLRVSYGQSRIYERNYQTFIANNDYEPGFSLKLLRKDLEFAMQVAEENQLDLPISKTLLSLYQQVEKEGYGDQDMAVLYQRVLEQSNKREAAK
ncbi:NAD(P)-dependent oxidoreductase [Virgibacillus pantothenticus]|uniref:NAD(P)-dependent oxidoreductase n=1 Tax=Virgibacillus pantothenticus TaxID=1473 RepID=UPI0009857D05|nr:NAD(P)-dependent oxidoreductase [Virgibacillus pantothenticus]